MANLNIDQNGNFWIGTNVSNTFSTAQGQSDTKFYVTNAGAIHAESGDIGGIVVDADGVESDNYDASTKTGWRLDNSTGIAQYFDIDIVLENTASGSPSATQRIDIGNSQIFDLGNQGLTVSSNALRTSKFKAIAIGSASNPPISIVGDYAELGFFATNDTSVGGFTTMHATNGTSDVFHWNSTGTNVTFHGNVTIEGSQISVNGDTGGNNQFLGYNGSGTLGFHSVSGSSHPDSDHTSFAASSHDHNSTYYTETEVNNLLANKDNYNYWRLREDGNNVGTVDSTESVNFIGGSGITVSNSGSGGDHNITISASGTAHTHTSVLSISVLDLNLYRDIVPQSSNSKRVGTSSSNRMLDVFSRDFHGGTFYGTLVNSSSQNTKTNIEDTGLGLDFIEALPVKQFNYITADHSQKKYTGVIAEDVQVILDNNGWDDYYLVVDDSEKYSYNNRCSHPVMCDDNETFHCEDDCCSSYFKYTEEDGSISNWLHHTVEECEESEVDGNRHPHFNYYQLIGPLVKAVQELSTQISDLTARIEVLEG